MRMLFKSSENVSHTFGDKFRDLKEYESKFYFGFEESTIDNQNYLNYVKKNDFDREGDIVGDIYLRNVNNLSREYKILLNLIGFI